MKDLITPIVEAQYIRAFGNAPTSVTDFSGNPASAKNKFLYSAALDEFSGMTVSDKGEKHQWRVYKNDEAWDFIFEPMEQTVKELSTKYVQGASYDILYKYTKQTMRSPTRPIATQIQLAQDTETIIKQVFEDVYGYKPTKIRDYNNNPPSEENSYLFNAMFAQYEGICQGKSSIDYLFFIFFNSESKGWEYSFTPLPKKQTVKELSTKYGHGLSDGILYKYRGGKPT